MDIDKKRYNEILGWIINIYPSFDEATKRDAEYYFPELKESEDERIRKEMIEIIKNEAHEFPSSVIANKSNSWIAWLEKKGEQKQELLTKEKTLKNSPFVEQNPWSEEDREMRMKVLKYLSTRCNVFEYEEVENWLKSLNPQSQWKPSDEQIEALKGVQEGVFRLGILESLYNDLMKLKGG